MRSGLTTGTCAAAAVKAAMLACQNSLVKEVSVTSPQGKKLLVPISKMQKTAEGGMAEVIKDAGDDPDITHGATVSASVTITTSSEIIIKAGKGVGIVTKPGLSVPVGAPAINPGPRKMIMQALTELLPSGLGCIITISILAGEELAKRTLNPSLGIEGGLSIIGTTGIVDPMSEEAFKNSLAPQISMVKALGYRQIVFAPGKIGQDIAINQCKLPKDAVIQTSNFIGYMLEKAVEYDMKKVLLFGHLGKLAKIAAGVFHTHNRMADGRLETIAAYMAAEGASQDTIKQILACTTTEAAMSIITATNFQHIYNILANRASLRAMKYVFKNLQLCTVIVTLQGEILGFDSHAQEIGGELGWNIKSLL